VQVADDLFCCFCGEHSESVRYAFKNESQKPHPCKNPRRKDGPPVECCARPESQALPAPRLAYLRGSICSNSDMAFAEPNKLLREGMTLIISQITSDRGA
jgi:hypothetical protein